MKVMNINHVMKLEKFERKMEMNQFIIVLNEKRTAFFIPNALL